MISLKEEGFIIPKTNWISHWIVLTIATAMNYGTLFFQRRWKWLKHIEWLAENNVDWIILKKGFKIRIAAVSAKPDKGLGVSEANLYCVFWLAMLIELI